MALTLPKMDPCYFCEIVHGNSNRWSVIAQDELTITVLNGRQFEVGQSIVIPVRHAPTLFDLEDSEAAAIMASAKFAANLMMEAFGPSGILLYQNNGVGSGQEVPHFHLHVVPRNVNSDWGMGPPHIARLENSDRPAHLDHTIVTKEKTDTVAQLRQFCC